MVRPESELVQIAVHVLARDVDMRPAHRVLEQVPEALDIVHMVPSIGAVVVAAPFLLAVPIVMQSNGAARRRAGCD